MGSRCVTKTANWLVRKIKESRDYRARVAAWAEREIHRAEREEKLLFARFGEQLEKWIIALLSEDGNRRKSVSLPAGQVGFRLVPPNLLIEDEVKLREWCEVNLEDALALNIRVAGAEIRKVNARLQDNCNSYESAKHMLKQVINEYVKDTGEVPEGTRIVGPVDRIYVR
jgi:hypothetical protein